jgi:hypothetical protein
MFRILNYLFISLFFLSQLAFSQSKISQPDSVNALITRENAPLVASSQVNSRSLFAYYYIDI